ncbi:MAG TPA: chemotaxis protein CheW [Gemmatimonadaceae bacterium]|nr:chemotaxis protein CheW [Gemmatimonadaceae bacterium]
MFRDGTARLLVFRVGSEHFGLPLSAVDEVIEAPAIQPLPDASATQLGLATLRDEVITVYGAAQVLRARADTLDSGQGGTLLLFQREARRVGLAVDDVHDAITVAEDELRAIPGADASDRTLLGVVRRNADLIAVLDVDAVLDLAMAVATDGGDRS